MNGFLAFGPVKAASHGLAVDGDNLRADGLAQAPGPAAKVLGKLRGIEHGKDPAEGIMAGDAIDQGEKAAEKLDLGVAEFFKIHNAFGTAEHRAVRDREDGDERVVLGAVYPRVFNDCLDSNPKCNTWKKGVGKEEVGFWGT